MMPESLLLILEHGPILKIFNLTPSKVKMLLNYFQMTTQLQHVGLLSHFGKN